MLFLWWYRYAVLVGVAAVEYVVVVVVVVVVSVLVFSVVIDVVNARLK